jgi:hypothetical protein
MNRIIPRKWSNRYARWVGVASLLDANAGAADRAAKVRPKAAILNEDFIVTSV